MGKKSKSKKKKNKDESIYDKDMACNSTNTTHSVTSTEKSQLKYTVDDLLERVDQYLECFEFDLAKTFCEKALKLEPNNTKVIEVFGNVCAESGDIEKAKDYFKQAVDIEPDKGHIKYLYLGQLSEAGDAVKYYMSAVDLLKKELNNEESAATNQFQIQLSNIYCSLAEIYMTDCCMEENAQELCENYCKLATEAYDNHIDPYIAYCNYFLSCNEMDNAKNSLQKAFSLWKTRTETEPDNIQNIISYETRVTLIKILIEMEQCENVSQVVDQLIEENEDDVRIWYYLGLAKYFLFQENNELENPRFYLEKSLELFEKLSYDDEEMKGHILELLESCPAEEMEMVREEKESDSEIESENEVMET